MLVGVVLRDRALVTTLCRFSFRLLAMRSGWQIPPSLLHFSAKAFRILQILSSTGWFDITACLARKNTFNMIPAGEVSFHLNGRGGLRRTRTRRIVIYTGLNVGFSWIPHPE